MKVINFAIAKHPLNWAIVFLMVLIAGFAGSLVMAYFGRTYATAHSNPATTKKPAS